MLVPPPVPKRKLPGWIWALIALGVVLAGLAGVAIWYQTHPGKILAKIDSWSKRDDEDAIADDKTRTIHLRNKKTGVDRMVIYEDPLLPAWIKLPPKTRTVMAYAREVEGRRGSSFQYQSSGSLKPLAGFFRKQLEAKGLQVTEQSVAITTILTGKAEDFLVTVQVTSFMTSAQLAITVSEPVAP